jgi:urease accessory protein
MSFHENIYSSVYCEAILKYPRPGSGVDEPFRRSAVALDARRSPARGPGVTVHPVRRPDAAPRQMGIARAGMPRIVVRDPFSICSPEGPLAQTVRAGRLYRAGEWQGEAAERLVLDYEARFLRRRRVVTESGRAVMVDLPETVSLHAGDALETEDGALVEVAAAAEPLLKVAGDLPRLAWHIGNRHTPCQVAEDHLLIRADHVLADMLRRLGAEVTEIAAPFTPEGGAYGHGRTHGHDHGHDHAH